MATASMNLHSGGRVVTPAELDVVPCPPPEGRWRPVPHGTVLQMASEALQHAGYSITRQTLALAKDDQRFFATLVLGTSLAGNAALAVGLRSSHDKSISLQACFGSHVFVCSNLAFGAQYSVARRHTTFGVQRYQEALCQVVAKLDTFRAMEDERISNMIQTSLTDEHAESLLLRAFDQGILSNRTLPVAYREWREPSFDFAERNVYRLWNACTFALGRRAETNPQAFTAQTIRLGNLLTTAS